MPMFLRKLSTIAVKDAKHFKEILQKGDVVADFTATWCGPCKVFAPVFDKAAESHTQIFAKIDIDKVPEIASEQNISSVPTIMIFKNEKMVDKMVGVRNESEFLSFLSKNQ